MIIEKIPGSLLFCANKNHFQTLWGKKVSLMSGSHSIFNNRLHTSRFSRSIIISAVNYCISRLCCSTCSQKPLFISAFRSAHILFPRSSHNKHLMDNCVQEEAKFNVSLNEAGNLFSIILQHSTGKIHRNAGSMESRHIYPGFCIFVFGTW